jgi:hypothetical protein
MDTSEHNLTINDEFVDEDDFDVTSGKNRQIRQSLLHRGTSSAANHGLERDCNGGGGY